MHRAPTRCIILRAIVAAAAIVAAGVGDSAVLAQTLLQPQPNRPPTKPPSPGAAKAERAARACSAFGPGFVNIPGSDACIKIGGSVTTEIGR